MSDNCWNIFPRSSHFLSPFFRSACKFLHPRVDDVNFTYNIIIVAESFAMFKSALICKLASLLKQEICMLSHQMMFTTTMPVLSGRRWMFSDCWKFLFCSNVFERIFARSSWGVAVVDCCNTLLHFVLQFSYCLFFSASIFRTIIHI